MTVNVRYRPVVVAELSVVVCPYLEISSAKSLIAALFVYLLKSHGFGAL